MQSAKGKKGKGGKKKDKGKEKKGKKKGKKGKGDEVQYNEITCVVTIIMLIII